MDISRRDGIQEVIDHLSRIRATPKLFFGSDDHPELALAHLSGLRYVTLYIFDLSFGSEIQTEAAKRRGWWYHADGFIPALRRKGLNDPEIVSELIASEIEFWNICLERTEN